LSASSRSDPWNSFVAPLLRTATNAGAGVLIFWPSGVTGAVIASVVARALGAAHGWRMAFGHTYDWTQGSSVAEFVVDNTGGRPDALVGSLFATANLWNSVGVDTSRSSGSLYHNTNWFGTCDTTLGNVTVGTVVPKHEAVHALQAWIFGPLFYPIFILSYVVCTVVPYWLAYHDNQRRPIKGTGSYFQCGVYPNTWFEVWAHRVQGSPPCG